MGVVAGGIFLQLSELPAGQDHTSIYILCTTYMHMQILYK